MLQDMLDTMACCLPNPMATWCSSLNNIAKFSNTFISAPTQAASILLSLMTTEESRQDFWLVHPVHAKRCKNTRLEIFRRKKEANLIGSSNMLLYNCFWTEDPGFCKVATVVLLQFVASLHGASVDNIKALNLFCFSIA